MSATSGCSGVWRPWRSKPKNPLQRAALGLPAETSGLGTACPTSAALYRRQVCVPPVCLRDCPQRLFCRYWKTRERAGDAAVFIQICNHNYSAGPDAAHRQNGLRPLLGDLPRPSSSTRPTSSRRPPGRCTGESLAQGELLDLCKALGERGGSSPPPNGCGRKFPHCGTPSSAVKMTRTPRGWPFA